MAFYHVYLYGRVEEEEDAYYKLCASDVTVTDTVVSVPLPGLRASFAAQVRACVRV